MSWDTARADAIKQRMAEQSAINRQNQFSFQNAPAQRQQFGGGQQYAGGDPNFDERTGQPYNRQAYDYTAPNGAPGHFNPNPSGMRDWLPQPRNGDSYLGMLMKKYGGAAQGFGQEAGGWIRGLVPGANRRYMDYRHRAINRGVGDE